MSEPIILIPLDGSERALAALPVAKVLGDVERASLRIFHVADRRPAAGELPPTLRLEEPALDDFTIDLSVGEPAAEILLMAGKIKPRLIVMCTHTAAKREKVLGSTAMNVVRNAACPVVLVAPERGSIPWQLQHVLVPHDGTPTTSAALPPVAELARTPVPNCCWLTWRKQSPRLASPALSPRRVMSISRSMSGLPGRANSSNGLPASAHSATCTCGRSWRTAIPRRKSCAWRESNQPISSRSLGEERGKRRVRRSSGGS